MPIGAHFFVQADGELRLIESMPQWDGARIDELSQSCGGEQIAIDKTTERITAHVGFGSYDAAFMVTNGAFKITGYYDTKYSEKVLRLPSGSMKEELLNHFKKDNQKRSS